MSGSASMSKADKSKAKGKPSKKDIPHGRTPTIHLIVCRCGSPAPLLSLLLSSSFSLFTFCVASNPVPTTSTISTIPPTPPLYTDRPGGKSLNPKIIILVSVLSTLLLAFLVFMAFLRCFGIKITRKSSKVIVFEENTDVTSKGNWKVSYVSGMEKGDLSNIKKYSWVEIEKLTKNFSRVVATGGFSTVYLAGLGGSSLGVIKVHNSSERLNQAFKQELDILLRLNHENIVKLLGYCDTDEDGALVFEYIPYGNLQEKLHDGIPEGKVIPWKNRLAIAYQLAQAIEYLHEKCPLLIVHGDIKSSNILLDNQLNCKLCDFGFAKMGFSSTVLPPSASPGASRVKQVMMGSLGYTDPHYLRTGVASKKNDVYSFGVVVLEIVTGMEAFSSEGGGMLTSVMAPMLRECGNQCEAAKVAEMVDPRLAGQFDLEEARAMLSIAALCLGPSPTLRPSATQILQIFRDKIPSISSLESLQ